MYGEAELNVLTDYFNGDSESQPAVEKTALKLEWTIMKPFLAKHIGNMMHFFKDYIFPNISAYPNLAKLCTVAIVTPVTSVNCERGVSACNGTKKQIQGHHLKLIQLLIRTANSSIRQAQNAMVLNTQSK